MDETSGHRRRSGRLTDVPDEMRAPYTAETSRPTDGTESALGHEASENLKEAHDC